MKNVKRWLRLALPFLEIAAEELANQDPNTTGPDDRAAEALRYAKRILSAVLTDQPLPQAPDALK